MLYGGQVFFKGLNRNLWFDLDLTNGSECLVTDNSQNKGKYIKRTHKHVIPLSQLLSDVSLWSR